MKTSNSLSEFDIIKQEYSLKYSIQCSDTLAQELLEVANNDVTLIVKTIQHTEKHYKLKEFIEANAKKKVEQKERKEKKGSTFVAQLELMFEPFLNDENHTIDQAQYNAIIAQRQGLPYNRDDYQQGMFYIQKQMYKHPIQWVHGLGLTRWEELAFAELVPEQQKYLNLNLLRKAGVQYQKQFTPDQDITPLAIQKMFGMQRIEIDQR